MPLVANKTESNTLNTQNPATNALTLGRKENNSKPELKQKCKNQEQNQCGISLQNTTPVVKCKL